MNFFNLHTHTHYCDGKSEPEAYVRQALDLGFHTLGFSGHAPVPFENTFAIRNQERLGEYRREILQLKKKFRDHIQVLLSLEIDYVPGITRDFSLFRKEAGLDYVIGGVHLVRGPEKANHDLWFIDGPLQEKYDDGLKKVFKGNPRKGVTAYYHQLIEMAGTQDLDIIAHLDKIKMHNKNRYFSEEESWYKELVWKVLKFIAGETNAIIEVNTRGLYKKRSDTFFPGPEILEQVHHLNIPVTLSSDAHKPDELNGFYTEGIALLKDIGFRELTYFQGSERAVQRI